VVESAKWSAWAQCGDMARVEAMRLYVKTVEERNPHWWSLATAGGDPARTAEACAAAASASAAAAAAAAARAASSGAAAAAAPPAAAAEGGLEALLASAQAGAWQPLPVGGPAPRPRYEHAAAVAGDKLYLLGGCVTPPPLQALRT